MKTIGKRILLSIPLGWILAVGLILISLFAGSEILKRILPWNILAISSLAGNGPILRYDAQGRPEYEGTPVLILFELIGLISSFIIYPVLVFLVLSLYSKFWLNNKKFTDRNFR